MPTVLRRGPYRFFFYSSDRAEPPHVHVERDENLAKFWLDPVRLHEIGHDIPCSPGCIAHWAGAMLIRLNLDRIGRFDAGQI